ncbi:hypothetical protein BGZ95_002277 [Linnemannia exigua]|uniref:HCP-like protein n=1 Tax=Linnemannia exigua TaxID=604196 RepID=A0AAD4DIL6_9FUNG|nr:hypothetical protein BGZ95_002277 [Linnemannia exigua]
MTTLNTHPGLQAARQASEKDSLAEETAASRVSHLPYHADSSSGKDVILWADILKVFNNAIYARSGTVILPFLKGPNFKNLEPLRIAAAPGITLDVVVKSQMIEKELSSKRQEALSLMHQDNDSNASANSIPTLCNANTTIGRNPAFGSEDTAMGNYTHMDNFANPSPAKGFNESFSDTSTHVSPTAVVRSKATKTTDGSTDNTIRNPEGGLEGAAMDNYSHIDNPAAGPIRRGPHMALDENLDANDNTSEKSHLTNITPSRAPQKNNGTRDITQTIIDANLGDTKAQVALGEMCKHGQGVNQDYKAAMSWFLKAAEQGDSVGQRKVGILYRNGVGVKQDYTEAKQWFQRSAANGDSTGQCNLGYMYEHGQGGDQSYTAAMFWYLKSAKQENSGAQNNIGYMYQMGLGVRQDLSLAMEWYLKATKQGNRGAQNNIGYMYQMGLGVVQDISLAMEWYVKAAEQGDPGAQTNIGYMYQMGLGVKQDTSCAMEYYVKAAQQGYPQAHKNIGWLYETARGIPKDMTLAIQRYKAAADLGDTDSRRYLYKLQRQGYDLETGKKRGLLAKLFK